MQDFGGLRVAAFESRRADDIAKMIERMNGVPLVSPSLREVTVAHNPEAVDFANRILTGQIDILLFLTGVGIKHFLQTVERSVARDRLLASISDVTTIVRGPKPLLVLKELGITPTFRVAEPNTWREVLQLIDARIPVANQVIGLLEYGEANTSLIAGLEARGAVVNNLRVYNYELPEDIAPLQANVRRIAAGEVDMALFTSSFQVIHLFQVAEKMGLQDQLRRGFDRVVIASVGPTMTETLLGLGLQVDIEPGHPKMGHLVVACAERGPELSEQKKQTASVLAAAFPSIKVESTVMPEIPNAENLHNVTSQAQGVKSPAYDSLFMKACRREPVDRTPIWLMRQAGRYMAEYREVRNKTTFLELCKRPDLCAEIMLTAVNRLGVDAAIIFADLLPILEPMGLDLEFAQGEGPVIHNPLREAADLKRFLELETADPLHFVMETVKQTRAGLPNSIPVLGFAGSPFTLASYAIEGGSSRNYLHTKSLMYGDFGVWNELMARLSRGVTRYLIAQVEAGADAVQLFDSWAGCLSPEDYRKFVLPYTKAIIDAVGRACPETPVINFATGNPALLPLLTEAGGHVIGIDWRISLRDAWQQVGYDRAVQGNLDPLVLFAPQAEIRQRAQQVLDQAEGRPGHIFNLGHGILQQTPVENVIYLIETVRELSSK